MDRQKWLEDARNAYQDDQKPHLEDGNDLLDGKNQSFTSDSPTIKI